MKKIFTLLLSSIIIAALLTGCSFVTYKTTSSVPAKPSSDDKASVSEETDSAAELLSGLHHIEIEIENYGTVKAELDADTAPITVTNFISLAKEGFYDGLTFHRVYSGFMIQGGDPRGDGTGGSENTIKGEFASNGIENDIAHVRGVISMARSRLMDSASSQFFIMHQDAPHLDGDYAAFGHVTEGIEIVDQICADTKVEDGNGSVHPDNQPKITSITVID